MRVAEPLGLLPGHEPVGAPVREPGELRVEEADLHVVPAAGDSAARSAASVPMAANIPVVMSAIATPTFSGGPSGSPVIDIPPASPWMAKSKPGRCASTLSGEYPAIDV